MVVMREGQIAIPFPTSWLARADWLRRIDTQKFLNLNEIHIFISGDSLMAGRSGGRLWPQRGMKMRARREIILGAAS